MNESNLYGAADRFVEGPLPADTAIRLVCLMRPWVFLIGLTLGLTGWVAATPVARASCAGPPTEPAVAIAAAPVAFVGTVEATSNGNRVALVRVESVWRGPNLPTKVIVKGTPDEAAAATSVDRIFGPGTRYLFLPINFASPFEDNSCTATQVYSSAIANLAPADARPPDPLLNPASMTGASFPVAWATAAAVGVVMALAIAWVLWSRRRYRSRVAQLYS